MESPWETKPSSTIPRCNLGIAPKSWMVGARHSCMRDSAGSGLCLKCPWLLLHAKPRKATQAPLFTPNHRVHLYYSHHSNPAFGSLESTYCLLSYFVVAVEIVRGTHLLTYPPPSLHCLTHFTAKLECRDKSSMVLLICTYSKTPASRSRSAALSLAFRSVVIASPLSKTRQGRVLARLSRPQIKGPLLPSNFENSFF